MKTLKLIVFLLLLVSPCVATNVPNTEENHVIHLKHPSGTADDAQKSGISVSIECYLLNDLSLLSFTSSSLVSSALVILENADTGVQTQSSIYLSSSNSYVIIPSSGEYYLSIILPDGTYYYGEFTLIKLN